MNGQNIMPVEKIQLVAEKIAKSGLFPDIDTPEKAFTLMLIPASTHTRYFHKWIWNKNKCRPRKNVHIDFLEKPKRGFAFGTEAGIFEIPKGKVGYIKPLMIVIFDNRS